MITDGNVEIDAPAQLARQVFSDVEHRPEWTASVTSLVVRDGTGLAVGKRFAIKQPGVSTLVWKATEIAPVRRGPGCNDHPARM